jgi:hypothetical protein
MHSERLDGHQKFKELAALAQRGAVSDVERLELTNHLRVCRTCRQVSDEYALLSAVGIPALAASRGYIHEAEDWDEAPAREVLFARIREAEERNVREKPEAVAVRKIFGLNESLFRWAVAPIAACLLFGVAAAMYWMGTHAQTVQSTSLPAASVPVQFANQKKASDELIANQGAELSQLQTDLAKDQQEIVRLQVAWQAAENRFAATVAADAKKDEKLREVSAERDQLASQLREAEVSYQLVQAELTNLRAEHDKTLVHTTSLETKIDELQAAARDQERRLNDDEQYLSSDRDIRELMGARKLYIADVFDVDSGSRTRKPFGRVFYTQNKSLIFYAFDLDHQPGVKTASAFQVWGQRDAGSEEKNHATNLGILYMDSESNRRWVLRLDDPKQLAEIDAVFVTVEPHGGSQKPTGKPFLYALLRREANHP